MTTGLRFIQACEHKRPPVRPELEQTGSGHLRGGEHLQLWELAAPACPDCGLPYRTEVVEKPRDGGVLPIQQPPAEDLRNAARLLEASGQDNEMRAAVLLRAALTKLGEPTTVAIRAVKAIVPAIRDDGEARDVAMAVLYAQLEGK